jgi:hypothetical protein
LHVRRTTGFRSEHGPAGSRILLVLFTGGKKGVEEPIVSKISRRAYWLPRWVLHAGGGDHAMTAFEKGEKDSRIN